MQKVKVYVAKIGILVDKFDKILSIVAKRYADKYNKYKVPGGKEQELLAGALLYRYLGVTKDTNLIENEHGKLFLEDENVHFNLSHSGDYVVLAVADIPVGVDVEHRKEMRWNVARKVFRKDQLTGLEKAELISDEERDRLFARYWTQLEAIIKLFGCGFAEELDQEAILEIEPLTQTFEIDEYAVTVAASEETELEIEILERLDLQLGSES